MATIMVTGAAGFIGSNLTHALLQRDYHVIGVDNLSHGVTENIADFANHPKFDFHQFDILDVDKLKEAARECNAIVHLAAYKIPRYSDAYDTLTINANGSQNVIKAARLNNAKIIAASTSDVYGKNPTLPFSEESDAVIGSPYVKRWAYAISKLYEEQLMFSAHDRFSLDVVLLRFFGGYGPNQNLTWWGGPQSVFINQALDNEVIPIHGDGQQTRTFTYVSDHVDGIIRCIEMDAANNQVFNVGSNQEVTIEELARLIWRLVRGDEEPKIEFIPYETFGRYEDVRRRVPDIEHIRTRLDFNPQYDLETGLKKTIEWQVKRRHQLNIATPNWASKQ